MIHALKSWWRTRTVREQRLLLLMGALAALTLSWLLVIRPLGDAMSDARERHGRAVVALAEVRAQAALVAQLQTAQPVALAQPLDLLLARAASEAGFQVTRIDRQGSVQATMFIDAVRPQAFFGWVGQMESSQGLIVERLNAIPNRDQTLSVDVTFRVRSN